MNIEVISAELPPLSKALLIQWGELISIDDNNQRVLIEMHNSTLMRLAIPHKAALQSALFKVLGRNYRVEFYTLEPLRKLKNLSDYYEEV